MLQILVVCPPRLRTVTTLPCDIRKSYFSSLQQYDDVRNVKATAEKVSKAGSRFRFLHRQKDHRYSPTNTQNDRVYASFTVQGLTLRLRASRHRAFVMALPCYGLGFITLRRTVLQSVLSVGVWRTDGRAGGRAVSVTTITRNCVHRSSPNLVCRCVVTISSWLNFSGPAPPGRGSAAGRKFLAPHYYGQRAVFASLRALILLLLLLLL